MNGGLDDFLEHYGIKGMKWGVRRSVGSDGKVKRTRGPKESAESKKTRDLRQRHVRSLTNKQIETVNKRQQLETKFNQMNPTKVEKGAKVLKGVMATAGTGIAAYNMVNSPAGQALINRGKKKMYQQQKLF